MNRAKRGPDGPVGEERVEAIYRALFEAILAQELVPGMKLSEETIGSFFGVSRTVVRAVFNRLRSSSLIELRPNRGAFVASPSVEEANDVFRARICIEREIASILAPKITPEQIAELEAHLDVERRAHQGSDNSRSVVLSGEFHLMAARMAGNEVLARFLADLITRTSLVLALHGRHNSSECGLDEHATIIEAFRSHDADKAAAAMAEHLEEIVERTRLGVGASPNRSLTDILQRYA